MKVKTSELKVGDKFFTDNTTIYLVIDLNPSTMFLTLNVPKWICALNLTTYKIGCFTGEELVTPEYDNVFI